METQHDVWQAKINDIHLWSLIRFPLLRALYFETFNYVNLMPERQRMILFDIKRWRRYLRTIRFFQNKTSTSTKLLAIVNNIARYPTDDGKYSFDRLHGYLYDYVENPLIVESSNLRFWAKPDEKYETQIISQDMLTIWNQIKRKLGKLPLYQKKHIEEYVDFLVTIFDAEKQRPMLIREINAMLIRYDGIRAFINKLITRTEGNIALVRIGNYMGYSGLIIKTFHEADFHVVEQQHGLIHKHHYAYNFPIAHTKDKNHIVHKYTPDTFLTFGDYWSQVSNIPGKPFTIGYPHLSEIAEKSQLQSNLIEGQILVISASANPVVVEIIKELATVFPERNIVFKLHPREIHELENYSQQFSSWRNIQVIGQFDVYQLIAQSEVIASYDGSTVLIEASMFPNKRVFYHDTHLIPKEVGEYFEDASNLVSLIRDSHSGQPKINSDLFYAKDWQSRVRDFFIEVSG